MTQTHVIQIQKETDDARKIKGIREFLLFMTDILKKKWNYVEQKYRDKTYVTKTLK